MFSGVCQSHNAQMMIGKPLGPTNTGLVLMCPDNVSSCCSTLELQKINSQVSQTPWVYFRFVYQSFVYVISSSRKGIPFIQIVNTLAGCSFVQPSFLHTISRMENQL